MTKNEEHCIARCIQALSWCPKIVVADTGSSDKTKEIAKSLGCDVIEVPFDGFGTTRNRILDHLTSDWVLCFDADEVCTPELAEEIQETLKNPSASTRRLYYTGKSREVEIFFPTLLFPYCQNAYG